MTERICNQHDEHNHNHSNMKKTAIVVSLTLITMIAEIGYGLITGSMALLVDGIHIVISQIISNQPAMKFSL